MSPRPGIHVFAHFAKRIGDAFQLAAPVGLAHVDQALTIALVRGNSIDLHLALCAHKGSESLFASSTIRSSDVEAIMASSPARARRAKTLP